MIISHKYKFIYLKSIKTAGTSIEVFLSAYCGTDDIITSIAEDSGLRGKDGFKWHNPRNNQGFRNHMSLYDLEHRLKQKSKRDIKYKLVFDDYYKFTSIRNPWDIMVSMYHFDNGQKEGSFEEWLLASRHQNNNLTRYYKMSGEIVVDDFIRFETLYDDLIRISKTLNIEYDEKYVLHLKNSAHDSGNYRDFYTDETKAIVAKRFAKEINDFNYNF